MPFAGRDTTITHGDSTYIGRPFEVGLNDDCVWYVLGNNTAIDTIAGMWVKPSTTTSYLLEQNICGTVTYDTVKVTVNPVGIKKYANSNKVTIYPNPSNGSFVIEPNSSAKQTMQVYDVNGKMVLNQTINGKTSIDASSLNEGVYSINLISNEGVVNKRLVIVR